MKRKKESFFWTSYSDLMTSLFFIMLVLFILTVVFLHNQNQATKSELAAIKEIVNSTKELNNNSDSLFVYKSQYKKYVLNVRCFFDEQKTSLADMEADTAKLHLAGNKIKAFLNKNIENQYMMIIEGQASRNSQSWTLRNYDYSFQRALTLMSFWKDVCKIDFGNNCEIQIAGSGDGRYNFGYTGDNDIKDHRFNQLDALLMRERGSKERNNQRFIIHIIPKNIIEDEKNN